MIYSYSQLDQQFKDIIKDIDIPDSFYEKAETSYNSLSSFLLRSNSTILEHAPEIYLQGSFKIGTIVKPINDTSAYDVDIICNLQNLKKTFITQKELKVLVGSEIKEYASSQSMKNSPVDGKRCWTLEYIDEANFHIDILPSIDDSVTYVEILKDKKAAFRRNDGYIAIPDKRKLSYDKVSTDWEISNPKGFADWFFEVSKRDIEIRKIAESQNISAEKIKSYKVKTDLQRFVQILKRHRDVYFEDKNIDYKVSSIIITTLASLAYNQSSLKHNHMACLRDVIMRMPDNIGKTNGEFILLNPINSLENFANKWNYDSGYYNAFENWYKNLKSSVAFFEENNYVYEERCIKNLYSSLGLVTKQQNQLTINENKALLDLPQHQQPKWKMLNSKSIYIIANKRIEKGFSNYKQFESGDRLPKGVNLKFEAKAENINLYTIFWQITNTGEEAKTASCLRGDFYDGEIEEGRRIRKEETSYTGSHIVECYIVKDNMCYGKSEPFIVHIVNDSVVHTGW